MHIVDGLEDAIPTPELAGADGRNVAHPVQHLPSKEGPMVVSMLRKHNLRADDGGGHHGQGLKGHRLARVAACGAKGGLFGTILIRDLL